MALEGLNRGGAVVYDTSGNINLFAKAIAQQQLQRQKEMQDLTDYLSKVKTDGLRDADRDRYFQRYNDWRSKAVSATNERDWRKKAMIKAEADRGLLELQDFINRSKREGLKDDDFLKRSLDDRFRNQFADDAIQRVRNNVKLSIEDPSYLKDFAGLERQIDTSKVLGELDKMDDQLLQSAKYANPAMRPVTNGERKGTEYTYTKTVDPKIQAFNYANAYDANRDFKAYVQKKYANLFTELGEQEAKAAAIQDMVGQRPLMRQDAPRLEWEPQPDRFYEHYNYRMNNPLESVNESVERRKQIIQDIKEGVPGSGEILQSVVEGSADFDPSGKFTIRFQDNDRNKPIFYIPAKVKFDPKANDGAGGNVVITPAQAIRVNFNDPNYENKMNSVFNYVTGQNMDIGYTTGLKGNQKGTTVKRPANKSPETGSVRFEINGRVGEIPAANISEFIKKYPNAKRVK